MHLSGFRICARRSAIALFAVTMFSCSNPAMVEAADIDTPFDRYTVALSWMPGFCALKKKQCRDDTPHDHLIGLHGIWPSEPSALINAGISEKMWMQRGCGVLPAVARRGETSPVSEATQSAFRAVSVHTGRDTLMHEVNKHLICLRLDPDDTLKYGLRIRQLFEDSAPGKWLKDHAGEMVSRSGFFGIVAHTWPHFPRGSIVLRCQRDASRVSALTEIQLSLKADDLGKYPDTGAYAQVAGRRSSCPTTFLLPHWSN